MVKMHAYQLNGTVLRIENLGVSYSGKTILQNINLVEHNVTRPGKNQGQIIAFVGRSGRGKSTLLRTLTGLEKPTTGQVLIPDYAQTSRDGQQPAKVVMEGDMGFVNQSYTLFRHKTVYQALSFALRKISLPEAQKEARVMDWASPEKVNTWKRADLICSSRNFKRYQREALLERARTSLYWAGMNLKKR